MGANPHSTTLIIPINKGGTDLKHALFGQTLKLIKGYFLKQEPLNSWIHGH